MPAETLYIVVDISGSMQEMGKLMLARNIISFGREYVQLQTWPTGFQNVQLSTWNNLFQPVDLVTSKDTPSFVASGRGDLEQLRAGLAYELANRGTLKVLFLSDGNFPKTELQGFCAWAREQNRLFIAALALGADASPATLRELSGNGWVFSPENAGLAIEALDYSSTGSLIPPDSLKELVPDTRAEEEWE